MAGWDHRGQAGAKVAVLLRAEVSAEPIEVAARAAACVHITPKASADSLEMLQAVVDINKCTCHEQCPARDVCRPRALVQLDPGEAVIVDVSSCNGCGDCVAACPEGAIRMREF